MRALQPAEHPCEISVAPGLDRQHQKLGSLVAVQLVQACLESSQLFDSRS